MRMKKDSLTGKERDGDYGRLYASERINVIDSLINIFIQTSSGFE